ncbi:MAG: Ig-like domain-containing protein [Rikenellaceae bacterium]
MQTHKIKIIKRFASIFILMLVVVMLSSRCASISMPLGGPYDTLPPRVVMISPAYGTTGFDNKRVVITFDEYIVLKDQQKEFFTSPAMAKTPTLTIRGKSLQIDLTSPLDSNTTYALNFGNTITDNNEGNVFSGFRYVFSTGDYIDSLLMSGYTVDAYTGDTLGNVFINFYDDSTADSLMLVQNFGPEKMVSMDSTLVDSLSSVHPVDTLTKEQLLEIDSVLYKVKPNAIARTFSNGIFVAENLAAKDYRMYAFQDNNSNGSYDPGVDLVGFTDSIYNPLEMPSFMIWYDTIQRRLQAEPQTYFRLFKETFVNKRANLTGITRPERQRLYLTFTGADPKIEKIEFDSIPSEKVITEYLTQGKDTMSLWLSVLPEQMPDSIGGRLMYQRYDDFNNLQADTVRFNLGWREIISKEREREIEKAEKDGEPLQPETLKVRFGISGGKHNPEQRISLPFDVPVLSIDSSRIELLKLPTNDKGVEQKVAFVIEQDTAQIRQWWINSDWQANEKYRLTIPSEALKDISGLVNDTLKTEFTIDSPEKYATFVLNLNNADSDKEYIVQIIDQNKKVLKERNHLNGGKLKIEFINPGSVRIRILEDANKNGMWDVGDLLSRRQPEKVAVYKDDSNNENITAKLNWELEFDVDLEKLFAPVQMEDILDNIQRMELEAQKKRDEYRKQQNSKNQQNKGSMF